MGKRERERGEEEIKQVILDLEELEFFLHSVKHEEHLLRSLSKVDSDTLLLYSFPVTKSRFLTLNFSAEKVVEAEPFDSISTGRPLSVSKILCVSLHSRDYSSIRQLALSVGKNHEAGCADGQFCCPSGIAISPKNEIYICDRWQHRIQVFDSQGKFLFKFGSNGNEQGQFDYPMGITLDHTKQFILITDSGNHRVQIFDLKGNFLRMFGSWGRGDGQFSNPLGITCDQQGNIYIADYRNDRVQIFDPKGNYLRQLGFKGHEIGLRDLERPFGIALLSTGDIVVSEKTHHKISIFDQHGNFLREFASEKLNGPRLICVDHFDRILVAEEYFSRISIFSKDGQFISILGEGFLELPWGVAVDPKGRILVADESHRVLIF